MKEGAKRTPAVEGSHLDAEPACSRRLNGRGLVGGAVPEQICVAVFRVRDVTSHTVSSGVEIRGLRVPGIRSRVIRRGLCLIYRDRREVVAGSLAAACGFSARDRLRAGLGRLRARRVRDLRRVAVDFRAPSTPSAAAVVPSDCGPAHSPRFGATSSASPG